MGSSKPLTASVALCTMAIPQDLPSSTTTTPPDPLVQVVIQCRADQRLACLRKLAGGRKSAHSASKGFYHPLISSLRPNLIGLVGKARLIEFYCWRGEIEMNLPPDFLEVLAACNVHARPRRMAAVHDAFNHTSLTHHDK